MIHEAVKFRIGKYLVPVDLYRDNGRIFFLYGFNLGINAEIKMMEKRTYHGYAGAPMHDYVLKQFKKDKLWSVPETEHNNFQIDYLTGKKPYAIYKEPLVEFNPVHAQLREHQHEMTAFILTRKSCIIAGEMGIGKTLSFIEAAEVVKPDEVLYVGPRSALRSVRSELKKWGVKIPFNMMTYRGVTTMMRNLEGKEFVPPQMFFCDESSRAKSPTSQRSEACYVLSKYMRQYWGDDAYIVLMSGTVTPNTPTDIWMQARIACPGFLIEGEFSFLKQRLAITKEQDFGTGKHRAIVAWKDRDDICDVCGQTVSDPAHSTNDPLNDSEDEHEFKRAKNEVVHLNKRLVGNGLMLVKLKKDCLDLPEKNYEEVELKPTQAILDIARTLAQSAPSTAQALMRIRALSDGFQYHEEKTGTQQCPICRGKKEAFDFVLKSEWEGQVLPDPMDGQPQEEWQNIYFNEEMLPCIRCNASGDVDVFSRQTLELKTPKEDLFKELLDEHVDIGRLVSYGGFQGTIDRMIKIAKAADWKVIKADGRGWWSDIEGIPDLIMPDGTNVGTDFEGMFQKGQKEEKKIVFIGQPGAAGMGLTLTASPTCFYYSKTFNAEEYKQSQDRIHRMGMDESRAARIINAFHLPTDRLVHNKLLEKIARQDLTLGIDVNMAEILEALR